VSAFQSILPNSITQSELYDLLNAAVQPRPIGLITTLGEDRQVNIAPFSYLTLGGVNPPSVIYSATLDAGGLEKSSLKNVRRHGEFVVNLTTRELEKAVCLAAMSHGAAVDKLKACELTPVESLVVQVPRIAESPFQLECTVFEILKHGSNFGSAVYVVGEIVAIHISSQLWSGEGVLWQEYFPIAKLGGSDYLDLRTANKFSINK
jgi:flavin reductase (DIM6/NTAB) family NADH-FMN oxidoreductase RutF